MFRGFPGRSKSTEIAAIGLGTGSVAAYGEPGRKLTFYEIDPKVRRIAENPNYFTYLTDCKADKLSFEMGDARLMMARNGQAGQYAVIIVDAFSSDAIPMHLLTKEAVEMYLSRLAEGGILCIHISNRYLDLEPIAGRIAQELGLVGVTQSDSDSYEPFGDEKIPGKQTSVWVMLARKSEDLERLTNQPAEVDYMGRAVKLTEWTPVKVKVPPPTWSNRKASDEQDSPLWTDDFSNLIQAVTAFQKSKSSSED
ncbi:MAG: fused MFS/spermidine synthase [Gemmataceae bacterium]